MFEPDRKKKEKLMQFLVNLLLFYITQSLNKQVVNCSSQGQWRKMEDKAMTGWGVGTEYRKGEHLWAEFEQIPGSWDANMSPPSLSAQRNLHGQKSSGHIEKWMLQNGLKRFSVVTLLLGKSDTDIVTQITTVPTAAVTLVWKINQDSCLSFWITVYILVGRRL